MPWRPLQSTAFAICVHPFQATEPNDLPLQVGDQVYAFEQGGRAGEWYRGYLVAFPSLVAGLSKPPGEQLDARVFSGIFPRDCVEIREVIGQPGDTEEEEQPITEPPTPGLEESNDIRNRRSQRRSQASRLSHALIKKRSTVDLARKAKRQVQAEEPIPQVPGAPKPAAPVPLLRVGDELGESTEEPLVDEIASCLREWHDARLHEVVLARSYGRLVSIHDLIKTLDTNRKQLMHDVMTSKELATLREDTVWNLVGGNKLLSDEIIVRNPTEKGRILTADDSVIEMTKLQANMSILDRPPKPLADMYTLYHVLVDVRNLVCDVDVSATLHVWLCVKKTGEKPQPVSEAYAISVPTPDSPQASHEQPKTLFINLSANDVGIGSESSTLYVAFRLLKDEPVRHTSRNAPRVEATDGLQKSGSVRGRRSFLGSQRKREHSRTRSDAGSTRPSTARSDTARSETSGQEGQEAKMAKRTAGVGAVEIGKLVEQQSDTETRVMLWTPSPMGVDSSTSGHDWNELNRELTNSVSGNFTRLDSIKRFDVSVHAFASSDLESLVRNTPTLLYNVHMTEKLGFTGVPVQQRSDIYLTLSEPLMTRNSHLSHSKFGKVPLDQRCTTSLANLQLTLEVRRGSGERIEDCIFTASNHSAHTAWRTTAAECGELWNQTIRLSIPPEDVPGSHVVMSIADSPNFPFALAWVPLWENGAFLRDGDHQAALYVYDEYSSSIIGGKGAYLALPPWHDRQDPLEGSAATVLIRTFLVSTQHSQDPNLLGLLTWRDFYGTKLIELLERFAFVPEIEIVKLLREVFAALFEILHEYANSPTYEDLVFYNFVVILSVAKDRRFGLQNVIEEYATTRHDLPNASQCLLRAYQRLLTKPLDTETSRKLRATLKVGDQMLKLIIETSKHRTIISDSDNNIKAHDRHPGFEQDLQKLFVALMALMRNPLPVLLGTQTLIVQHFHSWLPVLASLLPASEVLEIAVDLLDACGHARGKLILYRLVLILNYSRVEIFSTSAIARQLIANTFRWLDPYWGAVEEVTELWRDQVRLCCSIVATQMQVLGDESCQYVPKLVESYLALQRVPRLPKHTFSMLFPTSYPFPSKNIPEATSVDEAMLEMSALLAAALASDQPLYFDANLQDVSGALMQTLTVQQSILSGEAFPNTWLSLHVSHHRYALKSLARIYDILVQTLPDLEADPEEALEFDTVIWRIFFDALFAAVTSPALAMETFPEQKRRAVWKIAGDVREEGADLLRQAWESLGWETDENSQKLHAFEKMGGYQVQFVPDLVAPVVELCLSVHASLRAVAVEVLRSMIISAWEIDQDLSVIQSSMIDCLDRLCRTKAVTESYLQKTFIEEMFVQFRPLKGTSEDELFNVVVDMFAKVEDLLGMLANVHQGPDTNEASKVVETLNLMEFLKEIHSDDAYIRYVHQLADLQAKAGNHVEAGLALRMHAEQYEWDPLTRLEAMKEPPFPAQTAFERKENIYFDMCRAFERGQNHHQALAAYKELAEQYETNIFDFNKLARTHGSMGTIFDRINKAVIKPARFFRVIYKGLGFPINLRNREYIFETSGTDRLGTFENRLLSMHPGAQIVRHSVEPEAEGQFLQLYPVGVWKDFDHPVYQRINVAGTVRDHNIATNPRKFNFTTRSPANDEPIPDQIVHKDVYTTADVFPTILRRSEIIKTEHVTLSAIHAAIERTSRKTQELVALHNRTKQGGTESMSRMSDELLLSVDPDSESSVSNYRVLLPKALADDNKSVEMDIDEIIEHEEPRLDPTQNALRVALLDHALAIRRCLRLYHRSAHIATRAQLIPRFEATYAPELAFLFPNTKDIFEEESRPSTGEAPERAKSEAPSTQAAGGASETKQDSIDEERPRAGRRLSTSIRNSFNRLTNGTSVDGEDRRTRSRSRTRDRSQSRTRGTSRLRDNSLTRRLSFLRLGTADEERAAAEKEKKEQSRATATRDNPALTPANNYTAMTTAQLKKRLSALRDTTMAATASARAAMVGAERGREP